MKIYLVPDINPNPQFIFDLFDSFSKRSDSGSIAITKEITEADVYLFCTMGLSREEVSMFKDHALVKRDVSKCYMICDQDFPNPVLPGLFTALPRMNFVSKRFWHQYFRTIFYFANHNPFIGELRDSCNDKITYLFSFTGSETSGVRRRIFNLKLKRNDVMIRKTVSASFWQDFVWISGVRRTEKNKNYLSDYAREILQSKFVLCPKGNGNSSYRFFEVMEAGRVPVVISDTYMFPKIPYNWNDLVIRIKEKDIPNIESIVVANEHRFEQMAIFNRQVYDECFSNKISYIGKQLEEIFNSKPLKNNFDYIFF